MGALVLSEVKQGEKEGGHWCLQTKLHDPPPPSRQTWRPTSRRRVLPNLEGSLGGWHKINLLCSVSCVVIIPVNGTP